MWGGSRKIFVIASLLGKSTSTANCYVSELKFCTESYKASTGCLNTNFTLTFSCGSLTICPEPSLPHGHVFVMVHYKLLQLRNNIGKVRVDMSSRHPSSGLVKLVKGFALFIIVELQLFSKVHRTLNTTLQKWFV